MSLWWCKDKDHCNLSMGPKPFCILVYKHMKVARVFSITPLNISFRKVLLGDKLIKWSELVTRVAFVQLDDHSDSVKWTHTSGGVHCAIDV